MLSCSSLRQTFHTHRGSVHQAAELVTALLKVARVTAGLAESNSSLPPGFWLMSLAGWLPRTGISSGTLRLVFEYGLLFYTLCVCVHVWFSCCPWMPSPTFVIFRLSLFIFRCLLPPIVQLNRLKNRCPWGLPEAWFYCVTLSFSNLSLDWKCWVINANISLLLSDRKC